MFPNNQPRSCVQCGKNVKGRTDKKFCGDACRNTYNNQLKADVNNCIRNINHALGKNRRILNNLIPVAQQKIKISRTKLEHTGFQFKYFTHTYTNKKGITFFFCYEYGYLPLDHDRYLLVRREEK